MKPEKVFRIGYVSASIFLNEVTTDSGKRKLRNVNMQRSYRDGDDWKSTSSFGLSDLPAAMAVLQLATDYVANKEADATPKK